MKVLVIPLFFLCFKLILSQSPCIIDIDCEDCHPDNLPTVLTHTARNNILTIPHNDLVFFHCNQAKFILYPDNNLINSTCVNGMFRTAGEMKYLSDLGCKADFLEDISHQVDFCGSPYQGRSYQYFDYSASRTLHLVEVCYDVEKGRTLFTHMTFSNGNNIVKNNHVDNQHKLSMLGNFNKMFDDSNKIESEKVYGNYYTMDINVRNKMKMNRFYFDDQVLIPTKLMPAEYFENQNGRITKVVSNKVAVWKSVANGNLKNLQKDVVTGFKKESNDSIDVYVGTHGTMSVQTQNAQVDLHLKPDNKYPVPKYIWTVIYNRSKRQAISIVIVNDPFISISEIKNAVFCPSFCNSISWLNNLKANSNYERPAYGLVFCCDIQAFSSVVRETPNIQTQVYTGDQGRLKDSLP